ncbi:MAG TPA: hypothetical protein VG204_02860 [Terriglobia bacterium]|nr:hypothetical protein [Terriglobia bacterium]
MASRTRVIFQRILLGVLGAVLLLGLVVYSEGAVTVYVHDKPQGTRIWLPIPALLVDAGLSFVPDRDLREAERQIGPWLPAIQAASAELARCPDATLVEVKDSHEHVLISKYGDTLRIDVEDETDTVHIALPVGLVNSLAHQLEAAGGPA